MQILLERRAGLLIGVLCAPLIMVGVAFTSQRGPDETGQAVTAAALTSANIADAHLVEIRNHANRPVLSGEFRVRLDMLGNTERDAALVNRQGEAVIGEVELEIPAPGRTDRRPELEVDIIGLAARQTFSVVIDDRVVGVFTTDDRGSVDMELQEGELPQ